MGVAFDPVTQEVYVANEGSNNVTVISSTSRSVIANISVGLGPIGVLFDPATGAVFVSNHNSFTISKISDLNHSVVATIVVGAGPYGLALDSASDRIYVTNELSVNVSVLNASSGINVASIPVVTPGFADLQGIAYDSKTGQIWVGAGLEYLVLLNTTYERVDYIYTTDPSGVAYDQDTGMMCLTNTFNSTFQCFSPTAPVRDTVEVLFTESGLPTGTEWNLSSRNGPAQNSSTSQLKVELCSPPQCQFATGYQFVIPPTAGFDPVPSVVTVDLGHLPPSFGVNFTQRTTYGGILVQESGLAQGTGWDVAVNGTTEESVDSWFVVDRGNGFYNFTVGTIADYAASPREGVVTVNGSFSTVTIVFAPTTWYAVFAANGLPFGVPWYVNLTSGPSGFSPESSGPLDQLGVSFQLTNGSYTYTAESADKSYVTAGTGAFSIWGTSFIQTIVFSPENYSVAFEEAGLPAGSTWSVLLNGTWLASDLPRIVFQETNGNYPFLVGDIYGFTATPSAGAVIVRGSDPTAVDVYFSSSLVFSANFHESGLPAGTGWSVAVGAQFQSSLTSNVTIWLPNGTYGYVIQSVAGYTTTFFGFLDIVGANASVEVVWTPQTFPVIVVEFGLPNGTNWSVTIQSLSSTISQTFYSNSSAIILYLPNGSYSISVRVPAGFTASLSSGFFTVAGESVTAPTVHALPTGTSSGTTQTPPSLPPSWYWWILGAALAGIIALIGLVLAIRRSPPMTKSSRDP